MTTSTIQDPSSTNKQRWGRVLICGGTDWPKLGRKDRAGSNKKVSDEPAGPDLLEPHILRSLSNVKVTSIHTSCAGCQCVCLDIDGAAWLFGRNEKSSLGNITGNVEDIFISENGPVRLTPQHLGAPNGTTFVDAACGRNHTILVGSNGQFWSAGVNQAGQCAQPPCPEVTSFKLGQSPEINGVKERVVKAAAGINFSLVLTHTGKVFSFGSAEKGQLGNGKTGEHIVTGGKTMFDYEWEPILVRGMEGKKVTQIACGQQHSIALDDKGVVYVWGYNGYCRLGLGNQKDVLIPQVVPQFAGPNEITMGYQVVAGPSNSVVIDKQNMYWMAGKWKNTGDGSSGQPYSSFRIMQDIMGCKVYQASCGGVTHFALAPDDDNTIMTIAYGQGAANGELGLGPDEPKSATKPTRHQPLIGIDVIQVSAAQNTTFFLAEPSEKLSDLPRHPLEMEAPELCVMCNKDNGDDDSPLECEKCDNPYHLHCLNPPLAAVPDGEWFCPDCEADPGAPIVVGAGKRSPRKVKPVKPVVPVVPGPGPEDQEEDDDDEIDEDDDVGAGRKRKASASGRKAAPAKRKR
ncbi:RCC1/BLIP-II [Cristinia sonorae]|uniref:RCC1/BLIP-II n=1 Tax=Cristinia sonorae TaxID=1940300 RepID=A0A8K0UU87_9AGAR|nr:RCC1/BLIP-II [Cristinia sonorae]